MKIFDFSKNILAKYGLYLFIIGIFIGVLVAYKGSKNNAEHRIEKSIEKYDTVLKK